MQGFKKAFENISAPRASLGGKQPGTGRELVFDGLSW
jgi:hypothetical protein